jgi:hypothetical protein
VASHSELLSVKRNRNLAVLRWGGRWVRKHQVLKFEAKGIEVSKIFLGWGVAPHEEVVMCSLCNMCSPWNGA